MPNQIDTNHANNLVNTQTEIKNASMENNNQELASGFTQIKVKKNFSILNPLIEKRNLDLGEIKNDIDSINKKISYFYQYLDEKEKKIKRYEDGYDQKITKNFHGYIFKIIDYILEQEQTEELSFILDELMDMLYDNGIKVLEIQLKKPFKPNEVKIRKIALTDNKALHKTVAKIIRQGYYVQITDEQKKILRQAEIYAYKFEDKGLNHG